MDQNRSTEGIGEVGVFCGVCHRRNDGASDFCTCRETLVGYRPLNAQQVASWVSGQIRERDTAGASTATDDIDVLRTWAASGQPLHTIRDSGGRMSDMSEGPGWWLASDGRWYPPQSHMAPVAPTTNGLAIASLVVGILVMGIGSVIAVVLGHVALSQIKESHGTQGGRGMAVAGLVVGYVGIALTTLVVLLFIGGTLFTW